MDRRVGMRVPLVLGVLGAAATLESSHASEETPLLRRRLDQSEAACSFSTSNGSTLEFAQGESFGDIFQTPCGSSVDFPCFCDVLGEDDNVRCPYCPFLTNDLGIVCARDGESVTFLDEFGVEQTCTCQYEGNNMIRSVCDPRDAPAAPSQQCALVRKTEECDELTEFIDYDPDCECLNFCGGQFSGCCKYGETCAITCPGFASTESIVGGCQIDPNKPPVPPTNSPTEGRKECLLQSNTENCPALLANQPALPDCGPDACYNYCDNAFASCCNPDDPSCSFSCAGSSMSPVITAGCQFPAEPQASTTPPTTTRPVASPTDTPVSSSEAPTANAGVDSTSSLTASPVAPDPVPLPTSPPISSPTLANFLAPTLTNIIASTDAPVGASIFAPTDAPATASPVNSFVPPNQRCALVRNEERCAELTEFINYDADCDCLNFCGGSFVGCCNFGEACSVSCPGFVSAAESFVGGCKIDPNKPPSTPPPSPPTNQPTQPRRQCILNNNLQNCPALLANGPVEGCGPDACYNFCDSNFANCCDPADFQCQLSCSGSSAAPPVITAGCQFPV